MLTHQNQCLPDTVIVGVTIIHHEVQSLIFSFLISPVSLRMGLGLSEVSKTLSVPVFASGGVECLSKYLCSESLGCSQYLFHSVLISGKTLHIGDSQNKSQEPREEKEKSGIWRSFSYKVRTILLN